MFENSFKRGIFPVFLVLVVGFQSYLLKLLNLNISKILLQLKKYSEILIKEETPPESFTIYINR